MKKNKKRLFSAMRRLFSLHSAKVCTRTHLASSGVEIFWWTFNIALKPFVASVPNVAFEGRLQRLTNSNNP